MLHGLTQGIKCEILIVCSFGILNEFNCHWNQVQWLNYDEWIKYIKYHAGITCIDTALVMENKPAEPTDSSTEAEKDLWETWERSNRLLLSFLKLSIADNVKPSMPRSTNVREFLAEI